MKNKKEEDANKDREDKIKGKFFIIAPATDARVPWVHNSPHHHRHRRHRLLATKETAAAERQSRKYEQESKPKRQSSAAEEKRTTKEQEKQKAKEWIAGAISGCNGIRWRRRRRGGGREKRSGRDRGGTTTTLSLDMFFRCVCFLSRFNVQLRFRLCLILHYHIHKYKYNIWASSIYFFYVIHRQWLCHSAPFNNERVGYNCSVRLLFLCKVLSTRVRSAQALKLSAETSSQNKRTVTFQVSGLMRRSDLVRTCLLDAFSHPYKSQEGVSVVRSVCRRKKRYLSTPRQWRNSRLISHIHSVSLHKSQRGTPIFRCVLASL